LNTAPLTLHKPDHGCSKSSDDIIEVPTLTQQCQIITEVISNRRILLCGAENKDLET